MLAPIVFEGEIVLVAYLVTRSGGRFFFSTFGGGDTLTGMRGLPAGAVEYMPPRELLLCYLESDLSFFDAAEATGV